MKKINLTVGVLVAFFVLISSTVFAQKFEGIVQYKSSMNLPEITSTGMEMTPNMQASVRKQLMKQMQRDYQLTFNLKESLWKEKQALDPVTMPASTNGMQIKISTNNAVTYINPTSNEYLEETEIFGKRFLIKDTLESFRWMLTNESKKIGNYTVQKAVYQNIQERTTMVLNDSKMETKTIQDTSEVIAWYSTEIPVSQGPNSTYGLPGLILELKQDNLTFLCTKIELNPTTPVKIEKPGKGKIVTRAEVDKIQNEKMKEMMKKYDSGDGGETRVIRIGG